MCGTSRAEVLAIGLRATRVLFERLLKKVDEWTVEDEVRKSSEGRGEEEGESGKGCPPGMGNKRLIRQRG